VLKTDSKEVRARTHAHTLFSSLSHTHHRKHARWKRRRDFMLISPTFYEQLLVRKSFAPFFCAYSTLVFAIFVKRQSSQKSLVKCWRYLLRCQLHQHSTCSFLYYRVFRSFSVLTICVCNFIVKKKKSSHKMLLKCC